MRAAKQGIVQRLRAPLLCFGAVIVVGCLGYHYIEGWNWFDSLYMSVTTVTTVGYGEVHPLGSAGRIFTMLMLLFGVSAFTWAFSEILNYFVTGELLGILDKRRMDKQIEQLRGHYILCGFGRMAEQVAQEFLRDQRTFVVVERAPEAFARAIDAGYLAVQGDSGEDEVLGEAGIAHAAALIAAAGDDSTNLFTVVTAHALNPKMLIAARANTAASEPKLRRAGANRVLWPYGVSGRRLAHLAMRPHATELVESAIDRGGLQLRLEEAVIPAKGHIIGRTLAASGIRESTGAMVIGIRPAATEHMLLTPPVDTVLNAGDLVIALGTPEQIAKFVQFITLAN